MLDWGFDPPVVLAILVAGMLYHEGRARLRRLGRRRPVPGWQRAAFFAGLAVVLLALESPIDTWADRLLWVHMVQHQLLILVAAPLLLLGAPALPWLHALPWSVRRSAFGGCARNVLLRSTARRVVRLLGASWFAVGLFVADLLLWHLPPVYDAALQQPLVHHLEHGLLFGTALLFWAQLVPSRPHRPHLGYGERALVIGLTVVVLDLLNLVFVLSPTPVYDGYAQSNRASALADQSAAAGVMALLDMTVAAVAFVLVARAAGRGRARVEPSQAG